MDGTITSHGVYVDRSCEITNRDVALIGDNVSDLYFTGTKKPYKVILMHGRNVLGMSHLVQSKRIMEVSMYIQNCQES